MPKKDRNNQPTANQELSTGKPRHKPCCFYPSGARTHLPLSDHAEPISQGHCWKWDRYPEIPTTL